MSDRFLFVPYGTFSGQRAYGTLDTLSGRIAYYVDNPLSVQSLNDDPESTDRFAWDDLPGDESVEVIVVATLTGRAQRAARYSVARNVEFADPDEWSGHYAMAVVRDTEMPGQVLVTRADEVDGLLGRLIDGRYRPDSYIWRAEADTLVDTSGAFDVDDPALMLFWREVFDKVREQGNVSYWNTLATEGVVPDRHSLPRRIKPDDPRLRPILVAAAEASVENDMCEVYDQMCTLVGLPTREQLGVDRDHDFDVTGYATVTVRVPVSTTVRARSSDHAYDQAVDLSYDDVVEPDDIVDALRYGNYDVDSVDWESSERA